MESDVIKVQQGASKRCVIILGIIAGLCMLGVIAMAVLFVVGKSEEQEPDPYEQCKKDLEKCQEDSETKSQTISTLEAQIKTKKKEYEDNKPRIEQLRQQVKECTAEVEAQKAQVASLKTTDTILWIGASLSFGLGLGGAGFGGYELYTANVLRQQVSDLKVLIDSKDAKIKELKTNVTVLQHEVEDLNDTVTSLQNEVNTYTEKVNENYEKIHELEMARDYLNDSNSKMDTEIYYLMRMNLYFWIGGGVSLAAALGEGVWIFFAKRASNSLSDELQAMTTKYTNYFDSSYLWMAQDYINHYLGTELRWRVLYEAEGEFNKYEMKLAIENVPNTVTLITTDKNWTVAAVLTQKWFSKGYTEDQRAFILSVNRGWESVCPPFDMNWDKCKNAARIGKADGQLLEFGEGDIIINVDKTGSSEAGKTFHNFAAEKSNVKATEFYFGESPFKVKSIKIMQFYIPVPPT